MFDKDFQDVFDLDYFSLDRDGERLQHGQLIGVHFLMMMCFELILRRNGDLVKLITGLTFGNSDVLLCDQVIAVLSFPMTDTSILASLATHISPHKLELEIAYVFLTVGVVTYNAHSCMLAQIVLALLKDDFRVGDGSAHTKKASNLASYSNLKVDWGCLELRPIDVDHLRAFE